MKQFIVLMAVIPIMLLFMVQFTMEQNTNRKIDLITDIVYTAKEVAMQKGGFDEASLRSSLANALGVKESEIILEVPAEGTVLRVQADGSRGIIEYRVVVPLGDVFAGSSFLGIKDKKKYGYEIKSAAPSEYLGR